MAVVTTTAAVVERSDAAARPIARGLLVAVRTRRSERRVLHCVQETVRMEGHEQRSWFCAARLDGDDLRKPGGEDDAAVRHDRPHRRPGAMRPAAVCLSVGMTRDPTRTPAMRGRVCDSNAATRCSIRAVTAAAATTPGSALLSRSSACTSSMPFPPRRIADVSVVTSPAGM